MPSRQKRVYRLLRASFAIGVLITWSVLALSPTSEPPPRAVRRAALRVAEPYVAPPAVERSAPHSAVTVLALRPAAPARAPKPTRPALSSPSELAPTSDPTSSPELAPASPSVPDPANWLSEVDLQSRWSAETPDPAWSAELSDYLRETSIAAGLDASVVKSTECATTLCRIDLHFTNLEAAAAFQQAAQNPDISYQSTPKPDSDGEGWSVVVYASRNASPPGHEV